MFQILGFMGRAPDIRIRRVGFLHAHLVSEPVAEHVLGHFLAPAQFVDERLVEPRLVDAQRRVGQQAIAVETFDVVALEGAAVAPDVDVVFLHRDHQHGARDRAPDRRGVEVMHARRRDVERARLQCRDALRHQLLAAIDQPRFLRAVLQRAPRDLIVIRLVGLAEIRRIGIGDGALGAHPVDGGARVESAGEREPYFFARGQLLKYVSQTLSIPCERCYKMTIMVD